MIRRAALLAICGLLAATQLFAQRGNPMMQSEGASVDALIAAFMQEHDVAGMSVAIVQAPYITRATGYGIGDRERRTLVSVNTLFDIADMRNAFTAVAIMQLVETGKLQLDDVLRAKLRRASEFASLEELVASASGTTYEEFVRKHQFESLGLQHTFFASALANVPRESFQAGERHRRFLKEAVLIDPIEPATGSPSVASTRNAIWSTSHDLSIWDIGLAGELLIKDQALRKVLYAPNGAPANGAWSFPGHDGLMIATGNGNGFSSLLSRFTNPNELVCVTLLANKEGLDLTQLARRIAGAHNPKLGPPPRAAGKRVQESPHSLEETKKRVAATRIKGALLSAEVFEAGGDVWVAAADPKTASERRQLDAALLKIASPNDIGAD